MAIIQYTAIVNQIRGKLNGSVFNKTRTGYTLQRKQQPLHRTSALQSRRRSAFSQAQRRWKELTPIQQLGAQVSSDNNPTTDRLGNQVVLAGYNHFVKANIMSLLATGNFIDTLLPDPADPFNYILQYASFDLARSDTGTDFINQKAIIDIANENTQDITFFFYLSNPISSGITSYGGRWYLGGSTQLASNMGVIGEMTVNFPTSLEQNFPPVLERQRVLVRLDAWNVERGALVNSQFFSVFQE